MDPGNSRLVGTRVLNRRHINDVFYPAGMRQHRHRHDGASFSFVASGRYREAIGRQVHTRTTATLVYHPAGEWHDVEFETDVRIFSVEFRGETSESLTRGSSHRSELVGWLGARLGREILRTDSASTFAIDELISEMLAEGSRNTVLTQEKGFAAWLTRATEFLHDNFTNQVTLEEVAQTAGVHAAHLSRVFRQKMGCTVGDYLRRLRFEFACQQILSTDRQLCDVALEAGFSDQSHFNRLFRTRMGVTPFVYRKLHRAG